MYEDDPMVDSLMAKLYDINHHFALNNSGGSN
jgi:hypothetical protein